MSDATESTSPASPLTREELIVLVGKAHHGSSNEESAKVGRALADRSELPTLVAQNLGAGFGQWDFFPEPSDIVDFALTYKRPASEEDLWALARAWASDDAAGRHTLLALAGRDVLQHELRRIDIAGLRAVIDEVRPARARELRLAHGLEVGAPPGATAKASAVAPKKVAAPRAPTEAKPDLPPAKMPKPAFKRPAPPAPAASSRRFQHPKFGAGVLEAQSGVGEDAKLTIRFDSGSKTLLAKYVTELA